MEDYLNDGDAWADQFLQLQGHHERKAGIERLVKNLSQQQKRDICALIRDTEFRCDIIGKLPHEISDLIFQQLPIYQSFQCRRVCRRWYELLCCLSNVESVLRQWYGDSELALRIPEGLLRDEEASIKAEHIYAYRTGRAFSMMSGIWSVDERNLSLHVVFADGILAWIHERSRWVCLLYVESGIDYCLIPPNREELNRIAVSASMVAATTVSGKCHVWKLPSASHELDHFPIQLMSAFVQQIEVSGTSLAILHAIPPRNSNKAEVEITTWTMGSQKTIQFSAKLHGRHFELDWFENNKRKIILDSTGTYVSLFEVTESSIHHTRFNLKGQIQSQSSMDNLMSQLNELDIYEVGYSSGSQKSDGNGCATLWSFVQHQSLEWRCCGDPSCTKLIRIRWNSGLDHLEIQSYVIHGFGSDLEYSTLFFWKNVVYFRGRKKRAETTQLELLDLDESTVRSADMDSTYTEFRPVDIDLVNTDSDDAITSIPDFSDSDFLGNDSFLVETCSNGFIVWCFDKNIRMEKRSSTYEEEMEFRREKRIALMVPDRKLSMGSP